MLAAILGADEPVRFGPAQNLRQVAAEKMAGEAGGQTLQATALVHEAWLRVGGEAQGWQNRWHFFSAAAEAMRRILIDRVRSKRAERHGGKLQHVDAESVEIAAPAEEADLFEVHESLDRLAARHPQKAELVKLRYFVGLTMAEAAEVLGISTPTAERHWVIARVWLFREINRQRGRKNRGSRFLKRKTTSHAGSHACHRLSGQRPAGYFDNFPDPQSPAL